MFSPPRQPSERPIESIKTTRDFGAAYRYGLKTVSPMLLLFVRPNNHLSPRLGISIRRKVGPAHVRNRIKRLIREAARHMKELFQQGLDYVFVVRASDYDSVSYAQMKHAVCSLVMRIRKPAS